MMTSVLKGKETSMESLRNIDLLGPEIRLKKNEDEELTRILRNHPFQLISGALKLVTESGEVLQLLGPGEVGGIEVLFGQQDLQALKARALTPDVTLRLFPSFQEKASWLDQNPALLAAFLGEVSARALRAQLCYHRSKKTLVERTVLFLSDMDQRFGVPYGQFRIINLPLTKIDMASMLASTQESVVRVVSEMRKSGLISPHGKRVVILKPQDLAKMKAEIDERGSLKTSAG